MQLKSIRGWLLPSLAALVSIVVLGAALLPRLLDLDTYKDDILAQVKAALQRDLTYQTGEFSLRYGPSFTFTGITVKEKDRSGDLIRADRLTIKIALIPLLQKEIVLSRMQLERPVLQLSRDKSGVFNIADLFTGTGGNCPAIRGIELKEARIRFTDRALSEKPIVTELYGTDLYLSRLTRGKDCDFKLDGKLVSGKGPVPVFLAGVAKLPAAGTPLSSLELTGRIRTGTIDASHFWPYYNRYVPFRSLAGGVSVETSFKGGVSDFRLNGKLEASRVNLDYPQVFHARLTPKSLKASYDLEFTGDTLDISKIKLDMDGLHVEGDCRLSDLRSKDLRITASASSSRFNLRDFRQYIPYGIIVHGTADFIEQKIKGGLYRLDHAKLDGRVSQILHMERGENYNILSLRAHVEQGVVDYGLGMPVFNDIKGELELAGKDFKLNGMTGRYGSSPLALEGRIAGYPLHAPSQYIFTANVLPRQQEGAWLIGSRHGSKLVLADGSTMRIRGEGTTSLYHLSGDWDLTSCTYSYPELITKPLARQNTINFALSFTEDEFRVNSLTYNLAPLTLSATAVSRYDGPVTLEIGTNQFASAEIAPLVPMARRYQPSGSVQAQLKGTGPELDKLAWGGNIALSGVSFKAGDHIKPVSGVNGNIRISGDTLESSQISARLGSSTVTGKGTLSGFESPSFSLSFYSPGVNLADLGFPQGAQPLRVHKVQGNITYSKDHLQIGSLSGTLGKSTLQMKGSVQNLKNPQIDLDVTSPYLELDDITPLFGASSGDGSKLTLKAQITAHQGKLGDLPFQRLKCAALFEDKILHLNPFEMSSLDGDFTGKMRAEFGAGVPRYHLIYNWQHASAERVLRTMGVNTQELTGSLSLQGNVTARGESFAEMRSSANGAVKLRVEDGRVRKFAILSKVFSILNVSQLLKFQLPDMVSGGMPFNKLTGDFSVKDGIASTQNLFLDSNAINVSAIGKFDMAKSHLDLKIGVQPLQTVDKVVSRIPIVGWVLTGKSRSLITTYFEAKGRFEDPQVTAVPVKSLAKGVLNIFKRVFELPGRLITDTGEVITGN